MSLVRVLFVCDGEAAGAAHAAAIAADPGVELVGRAATIGLGGAMLAGAAADVAVVFASREAGQDRRVFLEAARRAGVATIVISAGETMLTFATLRERVRALGRRGGPAATDEVSPRLIAVGASTGGVEALSRLLSAFPRNCPPTILVQHMPAGFTTSFAARLNGLSAANVHEAIDRAPLQRGTVYLAPGGETHLEVVWSSPPRVRLIPGPPVNRHRPSIDVAFRSVAREVGRSAVGVLLTGMGRDGAEGLLEMRRAGARTFAQDAETSTVYGMPRAALEIGAVERGTPLDAMPRAIFAPAMRRENA